MRTGIAVQRLRELPLDEPRYVCGGCKSSNVIRTRKLDRFNLPRWYGRCLSCGDSGYDMAVPVERRVMV